MPYKILMPALSPTMETGNITKWLKKEGDQIESGDVLLEIETDKATMEVEASDDGILAKIIKLDNSQSVKVNSLIGIIKEENEELDIDQFISKSNDVSDKKPTKEKPNPKIENDAVSLDNNLKIFASPLAKKIAKLNKINLQSLVGTGPNGRIIKKDIINIIDNQKKNPEKNVLIPHSNMRKIIAKRLSESKITIPHFYLNMECIIDNLISTKSKINDKYKSTRISVNDFVVLACSKALKDISEVNRSWSDDGIIQYASIDIAVAVAVNDGIMTPIIDQCNKKSIFQVSDEIRSLAKRAKDNNLRPEESQGGSFTISNLGMYGVKNFNAIINPPQSCIMAVGAGQKKPIVTKDDKIEIRNVMEVNLSCDHRVVDGVVGAKFLSAFKKYIESPFLMFL